MIIPTKNNVVFTAECSHFGSIESNRYKKVSIGNNNHTSTFALSYRGAIEKLHDWVYNDKEYLISAFPKASFHIYALDGTLDKDGNAIFKKVYTLKVSTIKKYF